ncbi:MAG: hypothetical protein HYX43_08370 [Burkholderiales bacterium]|nr:hypothetical protein [Burkholderiales bacterium]
MQNIDLHEGETETPVASYQYEDTGARRGEIILTRLSLVVLSHPYRETFPLKGVQSIRVESGRNIGVMIALAIGMVLSLGCAAVFGNTIFLQTANAPVFMKTVPVGMLAIGLGLLYGLIRFRVGFARIVVQLSAGTRHYELAALNQPLLDFVRKVQQAL